jgi:predicted Fe-Mo cluster-binding NifX family protein
MKIAVPVSKDNQIEAHIGNCEYYNIFTTTDNKLIKEVTRMKSPGGCGCNTDIASQLASDGVSTVIAAGIGGGSTRAFNKSGINVIGGCSGDSAEVVKLFLAGLVEDKGSSCHKHQPHHHHEDHHVHHHVPEIAGIQSSEHKCGCGHGSGNSCNHS